MPYGRFYEIIGAAVGVLLLIIVAYVVVGVLPSLQERPSPTPRKISPCNRKPVCRHALEIADKDKNGPVINISMYNTGTESIRDFSHMVIFTHTNGDTAGYRTCTYDSSCGIEGTWCIPASLGISPDTIHPGVLDPGEKSGSWYITRRVLLLTGARLLRTTGFMPLRTL